MQSCNPKLIFAFISCMFLYAACTTDPGFETTTYYVDDQEGNDSNSGTSEQSAWQSLDKVNAHDFKPGATIRFRRGGVWRGQLIPKSGSSEGSISYAAYGSGQKPLLLGSVNLSDALEWIDEGKNIWRSAKALDADIGNLIFDNASSFGQKKESLQELTAHGDFYYDHDEKTLRLFSSGTPAEQHYSIEAALRKHVVDQSNKCYVAYAGLAVKYGGAHGFGGGSTHHITIRSCEVAFVGGGHLSSGDAVRFGNGIEFWGDAHDNLVEGCMIHDIYDSGVSNQNGHYKRARQYNIFYRNNIIYSCAMASFEYWSRPAGSLTNNIRFENNTCLFAGEGWGKIRPEPAPGAHVLFYYTTAKTEDLFIRNNIFYSGATILFADYFKGFADAVMDYNCIYQPSADDYAVVIRQAGYPLEIFTFNQFSDYQKKYGKDARSLLSDPLFADVSGGDFYLSAGSACIDAGTDTGIPADFDNASRPRGSGYDMGAYEF